MEKNEIYECDHLKDHKLKVTKMYGETMCVVTSDKTGRNYVVHGNRYGQPQLSLAHVATRHTELRRIE